MCVTLAERTKLTQTMRFDTTEARDTNNLEKIAA